MPEWSAEVEVDAELARRLIEAQFPELAGTSLRRFAAGWDNTVWVADERWAFRFPRRQIAIPGIEREIAVLPRLAPLLPLPIPAPAYLGRPADGYPWPFFGARLLPGREVDASVSDPDRVVLAGALGEFLRVLHTLPVRPRGLPHDPNRRGDMQHRVTLTREFVAQVERLGLWRPPPELDGLFEAALRLPPAERTATCHGDLHLRHLLVDDEHRLSAVIDWGDVCLADPCIDLSVLWSLFPPPARTAFLDAYGKVTDAQLLRARVLAVNLCAILAAYGHDQRIASLEREAVAGLVRAAAV